MTKSKLELILADLQRSGYRLTRPRHSVLQALMETDDWLRPEEVHSRAQLNCPSLGLVTVYRTLALLSELGYIRRVHLEGGCHGYLLSSPGHHHALICRKCGSAEEFPGEDNSQALFKRVEAKTGYRIDDHMLQLFGLCPACQMEET